MSNSFDINQFYSDAPIDAWKEILGDELHYHGGDFTGTKDFQAALRQAVRNHFAHIPHGARVLDAGCGWGGPARLLTEEHGCSVQCITVSTAQAEYCRQLGFDVWQLDLERDVIEGHYDVVLMHEVLSHIRDKKGLLARMRQIADRLVITVNCVTDRGRVSRDAFGGSMLFCSVAELQQYAGEAGWRVHHVRERRREAMMTYVHWKRNFDRVYGSSEPPGQLALLRQLCEQALENPSVHCHCYPLVDIAAD